MRHYDECPYGCGRRVSVSGGFPMPHNAGGVRCRPPAGWTPAQAAPPTPAPPPPVVGCLRADGRRVCGGTLPPKVRAPAGWLALRVGGSLEPHRWFCSAACLRRAFPELDVPAEPAERLTPTLDLLNRLAGAPPLTVMTATPARVRRHLERALARVVAEVDAQARRDALGRPTTEVLLAAAAGERIATSVCTRCGLERPAAEFYPNADAAAGLSSWCKTCSTSGSGTAA